MNDPGIAPPNQRQLDFRANLLFFLRVLARQAQERTDASMACLESFILDEQADGHVS